MAEQAPETRVPVPPQIEIIIFFVKKLKKYLQVPFQHFVSEVECNFAKLYRKVLDTGF